MFRIWMQVFLILFFLTSCYWNSSKEDENSTTKSPVEKPVSKEVGESSPSENHTSGKEDGKNSSEKTDLEGSDKKTIESQPLVKSLEDCDNLKVRIERKLCKAKKDFIKERYYQ